MDSGYGSQNCESVIPFTLEKPPCSDSRRVYRPEVRPTPGQRLLHFFLPTPADEPLKKKRFFGPGFGQESSDHCSAGVVPRNYESLIPFSLERASNDCGSDTSRLRIRPMLLDFFGQEGMQVSEADQGMDVANRSENELPPPSGPLDRELCALSLATRREELQGDEDLCALSLATYHVSVSLLEAGADQGADVTNWSENELGPQYRDLCALSLATRPASPSLLEVGASLHTAVIRSAQPDGAISNNTRLEALAPAKPTQAQPPAELGAQPLVAQPLVQSVQPLVQPVLSPGQPPAQLGAQPQAAEPLGRQPLQPPAQPGPRPLGQSQAQLVLHLAQPGAQPPTQPRAQGQIQPQAVQPRVQHGPQSKSSRFKGVTLYKRTRRWEAHIWDNNKKQIYLGASSTENQAARAYDRAAIHFRGVNAEINFLLADYQSELPQLDPAAITATQLVTMLRKQSAGKGTLHPEYPQPNIRNPPG